MPGWAGSSLRGSGVATGSRRLPSGPRAREQVPRPGPLRPAGGCAPSWLAPTGTCWDFRGQGPRWFPPRAHLPTGRGAEEPLRRRSRGPAHRATF